MGVSVFLQTIDDKYQMEVLHLKRGDWQRFHDALFDYLYGAEIGIKYLTNYFGLELEPLKKVAQIEFDDPLTFASPDVRDLEPEKLQKYLEEAFAEEQKREEENRKMWQSPEEIINALAPFLKAVKAEPEVFLRLKEIDSSVPYLYNGDLVMDLEDLLKMCYFAKDHGVSKVRLQQDW